MLLRAFAPILINDAMVLTYGCLIEILVQFMKGIEVPEFLRYTILNGKLKI